jgi:hypothetical protein
MRKLFIALLIPTALFLMSGPINSQDMASTDQVAAVDQNNNINLDDSSSDSFFGFYPYSYGFGGYYPYYGYGYGGGYPYYGYGYGGGYPYYGYGSGYPNYGYAGGVQAMQPVEGATAVGAVEDEDTDGREMHRHGMRHHEHGMHEHGMRHDDRKMDSKDRDSKMPSKMNTRR